MNLIKKISSLALYALFTLTAHAATYYVASNVSSPAGSDGNPGTQAAPWLTIQHAVNSMACGDTLMAVADGNFVTGDANLPYFANCGTTTTIQSSALSKFAPVGYRTNPTVDGPNYGKLSFTSNGIISSPVVVSSNFPSGSVQVSFNTSTGVVTISLSSGSSGIPTIANNLQVEFEPGYEGLVNQNFPLISMPTGLSFLTHYCVSGSVNGIGGPGSPNSTFQLKAADCSGSALSFSGCTQWCSQTVTTDPTGACSVGAMQFNTTDFTSFTCPSGTWTSSNGPFINAVLPLSVNTSTGVFTMPQNYGTGALANNQHVAFAAAGFQLFGTLPAPLQLDAIYCTTGVSGLTFSIAAVCGGSALPITSVGTGWVNVSSTDMPNNWAFRGLEMFPNGTSIPFSLFTLGGATESSIYGMVHHIELDRMYLHDTPPTAGIAHAIYENGRYVNIHDSWIIGANDGEAQAYACVSSPGPTSIINNFMEASGEVSLCGGYYSAYGTTNSFKLFQQNYFYKPPIWRITTWGGVTPSGSCLYDDTTDPTHAGGEYYFDSGTSTGYQCQPDGTWHSGITTSIPAYFTAPACGGSVCAFAKDMTEHKNGRYFSYIGNLYNNSYTLNQSLFGNSQNGEVWNNSMEFGSGPGIANDHITVMHNMVLNSYIFQTRTSQCGYPSATCSILPGTHLTRNNLMIQNPLACGVAFVRASCQVPGNNAPQADTGGPAPYFNGDAWDHNTIWTPDSYIGPGVPQGMSYNSPSNQCPPYTPAPTNLVGYTNNIVTGDLANQCGEEIYNYYSNSTFASNVFKNGTSGNYVSGKMTGLGNVNSFSPLTGAFPTSNSTIGYTVGTGVLATNYKLSTSSPFSAACPSGCAFTATDTTDVGADTEVVQMYQYCAQSGLPCPDVSVSPGSVNAVLSFTAPTTTVCTPSFYPFPGPRNANTAVSISTAMIQIGTYQEITIGGLTASSAYAYTVSCDNGWIYVGTGATALITRAAGSVSAIWPMQFGSSQTVYRSSVPNMTSACTTIGTGTSVNVTVGPHAVAYVGIAGCGAGKPALKTIIAP